MSSKYYLFIDLKAKRIEKREGEGSRHQEWMNELKENGHDWASLSFSNARKRDQKEKELETSLGKFHFGSEEHFKNLEGFDSDITIFTDGSSGDEKVGYGVLIIEKRDGDYHILKAVGERVHDNIVDNQHNYAGEMMGAKAALEWVVENVKSVNGKKSINYVFDYNGIAKTLLGIDSPKSGIGKEVVNLYSQHKDLDINLYWVNSHLTKKNSDKGLIHKYNDEVDELAKAGLGKEIEE